MKLWPFGKKPKKDVPVQPATAAGHATPDNQYSFIGDLNRFFAVFLPGGGSFQYVQGSDQDTARLSPLASQAIQQGRAPQLNDFHFQDVSVALNTDPNKTLPPPEQCRIMAGAMTQAFAGASQAANVAARFVVEYNEGKSNRQPWFLIKQQNGAYFTLETLNAVAAKLPETAKTILAQMQADQHRPPTLAPVTKPVEPEILRLVQQKLEESGYQGPVSYDAKKRVFNFPIGGSSRDALLPFCGGVYNNTDKRIPLDSSGSYRQAVIPEAILLNGLGLKGLVTEISPRVGMWKKPDENKGQSR